MQASSCNGVCCRCRADVQGSSVGGPAWLSPAASGPERGPRTMAIASSGTMCVTALMTPGSPVKTEGMADCATRKAAPSTRPGMKPSTRMRISTSRAVDRSFCGTFVGQRVVGQRAVGQRVVGQGTRAERKLQGSSIECRGTTTQLARAAKAGLTPTLSLQPKLQKNTSPSAEATMELALMLRHWLTCVQKSQTCRVTKQSPSGARDTATYHTRDIARAPPCSLYCHAARRQCQRRTRSLGDDYKARKKP